MCFKVVPLACRTARLHPQELRNYAVCDCTKEPQLDCLEAPKGISKIRQNIGKHFAMFSSAIVMNDGSAGEHGAPTDL
jgi:hypothetical protein